MFSTDITEYVRHSYDTLEEACVAHADAAVRVARWNTIFRVATLTTSGAAAAAAVAAATWRPSWFLASAIVAAAAFAACAAYVGFNQQPRVHGHRACSARLWVVCEQYRELLTEMQEGRIELEALRTRRHALLRDAAAVFEHVAPADRHTFEIARRALGSRSGAPMVPPPVPTPAG
ncbi:MAG TPA: hypothetical protein VGI12_14715 [Vicinamibacterales bacterium]|jgi:hypothetical protein